jgi:hypothetical protein
MTTIAASRAARPTVDARSGPADVFVAFGITWGPKAADKLVAGHGRWHDRWVTT